MADLKKTGVRLIAEDARAFESNMGKATGAVQGFGNAANSLDMSGMNKSLASLNLQQTGQTLTNSVSRPLAGVAAESVNTAATFEKTLSGIDAVLSPTTSEMGQLSAEAIRLGGSTKFSAQESASAIEMLAKNGLTATEILGGALDATLSFAAATGADLPTAADISTDAMLAFGKEAGDLPDIVDELVGVTVNSKFGWQDLALALAQGGGVFAGVGGEIEDFSATISEISPLFKSGSDAGTSLKVMMTRLLPSSKDAGTAMRELGIITEEGQNQFFTASGELRSMSEISGVLAEATAGLTEEQKNQYLTTIFGQDAMRAAIALSQSGTEGFNEMQASIATVDAGAQAATRMDNLKGSIDLLNSAVETLQISIGTRLLPVFRQIVEKVTEGVTWFTSLPAPVQNATLAFAGVAAAIGPLVLTLGLVSGAIAAIPVAVATLAPVAPAFLGLAAAGTTLATAWATDFGGIRTKFEEWAPSIESTWDTLLTNMDTAYQTWKPKLQGAWDDVLDSTDNATQEWGPKVQTGWQNVLSTIDDNAREWGPKVQDVWGTTASTLSDDWDNALDNINDALDDHGIELDNVFTGSQSITETVWGVIERTIEDATDIIGGSIQTVSGILSGDWEDAQDGAGRVVDGVWSQISMRFETAWGVIEGILDTFGVDTDGLKKTVVSFKDGVERAVNNVRTAVITAFGDMGDENTFLGDKVKDLQETWQLAKDAIIDIITPLWEIVKSLFGEGQTFLEDHGTEIDTFMGGIWESIGGIISTTWDIAIEVIQGAIKIIDATVVPVLEGIQKFIAEHGDEIQKVLEGAWEIISSAITGAIEIIEDALTLVLALLQGDWDTAWTAAGDIVETAWGTMGDIVDGAVDIIDGAVGLVVGLIGDSWDSLWTTAGDAVDGAVGTITNLLSDSWDALWNGAWDAVSGFLGSLTDISIDTEPFRNAGDNLLNALKDGMQSAWDAVWEWITGRFGFDGDGLARQISDFAGNWSDAGRDLIDGIKDGMADAWHRVTDWLSEKAKELPEPIREILGISSPSTVMAEETGEPIAEGVGVGFVRAFMPVQEEMSASLEGLGSNITTTTSAGAAFGAQLAQIAPVVDKDTLAMQQFGVMLDQTTEKMLRMHTVSMEMGERMQEGFLPTLRGLDMIEQRLRQLPALATEVSMRVQEQAARAAQSVQTTNNYNLSVSSNAPMGSLQGEFGAMATLNR